MKKKLQKAKDFIGWVSEDGLLEVIELLVSNNNQIMKLIDDSKYFVIEDDKVVTYKRRMFRRDTPISTYSFDEIIHRAKYGI